MLCKNCNYILTGKENYCPNCAAALTEKASQTLKNREEQQEKDKQNEPMARGEFIFPEKEERGYASINNAGIFYETPEPKEAEAPKQNKSYAGRILFLLFLLCILTAGFFGVADYFNITPSVFSFFVQPSAEEGTSSTEGFSHESSIIKPDITYTPERAYVMSGEGLSLRKGPGRGYAPVGNLSDLTSVIIYGGSNADKGWVYVYCAEKNCYGWLDGSFLARDAVEETTLFAENNAVSEQTQTASATEG